MTLTLQQFFVCLINGVFELICEISMLSHSPSLNLNGSHVLPHDFFFSRGFGNLYKLLVVHKTLTYVEFTSIRFCLYLIYKCIVIYYSYIYTQ